MDVTILEAQNRTGGRCLSLRTGDTLIEDCDSKLSGSKPRDPQVVRFERPLGDSEPYLNAGPGRIPSSHKHLLTYLRDFGVDVEIYVMNSESNLVRMTEGPLSRSPYVYRQIDHNVRGWIAEMVHKKAPALIDSMGLKGSKRDQAEQVKLLRDLMVKFGELTVEGDYDPDPGVDGYENARGRAGFDVLPGIDAGKTAEAIGLKKLLESEFWKRTRFYQPSDFLWQPTLFQPVGGMDRVQHAFAQQVATLGGTVHLNRPVKSIRWEKNAKQFIVECQIVGTARTVEHRAHYLFSNMAMPFLKKILSKELQDPNGKESLDHDFKDALRAVFKAQPNEAKNYKARFLADTTKVGWQAERKLWQGTGITKTHIHSQHEVYGVRKSEIGVVPIFGGISWSEHEIAQIWYPSTGYHDQKGVLTGAYNFGDVAWRWGNSSIDERLDMARKGAAGFGAKFATGLGKGVAIAWQNMPYIKGGWAYWQVVADAVDNFNHLTQGSGVTLKNGEKTDPAFFIIGDQLSSLPGWQEGAIAAALQAINRLVRPDRATPYLSRLTDTKLTVEGI